jgi:hypothetical protein
MPDNEPMLHLHGRFLPHFNVSPGAQPSRSDH